MSATQLAVDPHTDDLSLELASSAPFRDLPAPVLTAILQSAERRRYRAGETVFALGQFDGGEVFVVTAGALKLAVADLQNGAMLVEGLEAGALFGLAEAIVGADNPKAERMTLTAEADSVVIAIDAAALRLIAAQRPSLSKNLMVYFARALAESSFVAAPTEVAPERRVIAALMRRVERDAASGEWRIAKMPKHRELADDAGVDEALAAGAVARLIQDGVARRDYPGLIVADMARLERFAQ